MTGVSGYLFNVPRAVGLSGLALGIWASGSAQTLPASVCLRSDLSGTITDTQEARRADARQRGLRSLSVPPPGPWTNGLVCTQLQLLSAGKVLLQGDG